MAHGKIHINIFHFEMVSLETVHILKGDIDRMECTIEWFHKKKCIKLLESKK